METGDTPPVQLPKRASFNEPFSRIATRDSTEREALVPAPLPAPPLLDSLPSSHPLHRPMIDQLEALQSEAEDERNSSHSVEVEPKPEPEKNLKPPEHERERVSSMNTRRCSHMSLDPKRHKDKTPEQRHKELEQLRLESLQREIENLKEELGEEYVELLMRE